MDISLTNDMSIPAVGLGTWRARKNDVYQAVLTAVEVGYRHIDTAVAYENEEEVGRAVSDASIPRDQLFLTTKVWNIAHTTEQAKAQIESSLKNLRTDYLDLVLIHWPWTAERNLAVWRALEAAVNAGTIRAIGVSNFNIHHIEALLSEADVKPVVNQMECHVGLQNTRLKEFMDKHGMVFEAYAPLKSDKVQDVLDNKTLQSIAKDRGKTPTQIALRWLLDRGIVALPKSVNRNRIESNFQVFDFTLSDAEMRAIRKLNDGRRMFPEPDNVDFGFVSL